MVNPVWLNSRAIKITATVIRPMINNLAMMENVAVMRFSKYRRLKPLDGIFFFTGFGVLSSCMGVSSTIVSVFSSEVDAGAVCSVIFTRLFYFVLSKRFEANFQK